jgi:hypothetical protein
MKLNYKIYQGEEGWTDTTILVEHVYITPLDALIIPKEGVPFKIELDIHNVHSIRITD